MQAHYHRLKELANRIAQTLPPPSFYVTFQAEIHRAGETLSTNEFIGKCRAFLDESQLECAHGVCHCESVARDAGALILINARERGLDEGTVERLIIASEIAGLLHDIKRKEKDHAVLGSIEAGKILSAIGIDSREQEYITDAIRNHEAFKEVRDSDDAGARLVSDALYDADKFRWGPDNFTTTLWLMVEENGTPLESLHTVFKDKVKGIEKIKKTFRTETGRKYGPEFIDHGLQIGDVIYEEMSALLGR